MFFFSSRRRHTSFDCDWSSEGCSSDLIPPRITMNMISPDRVQCMNSGVRYSVWFASSAPARPHAPPARSEEHTSELQSQSNLVCRLLLEKKKKNNTKMLHSLHTDSTTLICRRLLNIY